MDYQEFLNNVLPEIKNSKSFNTRKLIADKYLTRIGSGTGRLVYDIDNEKVLKLAKNSKGIAQNDAEGDVGRYRDTHHIVTKIIDYDDNNYWLISEKAKKVTEKRIKELTNIPSLSDLYYYLKNNYEEHRNKRPIFTQDPETIEFFNENEFAQDLRNLLFDYNQSPGDMGRPSTYGEVLRDGQSTIVLTDYGLNDEVYSNYYSPQRNNKYSIYEIRDINNHMYDETHQKNWALMPYDVGNGDEKINEKFISFVENRNVYPNRNINGIPQLCDEFHSCINNLKEALNVAKDKKRFYRNLLELQDYLIKRGFYDRESLNEESVILHEEIPDVEPLTLEKNYADSVAKIFADKLNLGTPQYLGGGGYGFAYLINGNKVLKLTSDVCEVDAAAKTERNKPKTLVYVYDIYKIHDVENNKAIYALIEEFIANKPTDEFIRYTEIINTIGDDLYNQLLRILIKGKGKDRFDGRTIDDFPELAGIILTENPDVNISEGDRRNAYNFMMGLYAIKRDLLNLGIKSNDYITLKNLGYKDGVLIYFDIGGCRVPEPQIPDVVTIPENKVIVNEGLSRDISDSIANRIAEKHNLGTPTFIGEGQFGVAYEINRDLVLKITKDRSEAVENLDLIDKPLEYIAQPYRVFEIKQKDGGDSYYAIILEKLKTDTPNFKRMGDRLNFAFEKIMNLSLGDVLDEYAWNYDVGVDKNKLNNYFKKNKNDYVYFNQLLNIVKECKKYGVESMDYLNPNNLGYKKNGNLGFFDVGFGNFFSKTENKPEMISMDEDGTELYSTENTIGRDNRPQYNQIDTSPSIDNNIPTNTSIYTESDKSYMRGSKSVDVKKKCRLGGLGNTSSACNQGDIKNLIIKSINEEIDASEAYNDDNALKTIIDGKRGVGLISLYNPKFNDIIADNGLKTIKIKQNNHPETINLNIVYRDDFEKQAKRLYDIMMSHGGYLSDKTPEEAYEIGRLLGYSDDSIKTYINKKYYHSRFKIMDEPNPDDYNHLDEYQHLMSKTKSPDYWVSPNNEIIGDNHLNGLRRIYPELNKLYGNDLERNRDKYYQMAYNDGYTRINFYRGTIGCMLNIDAPTLDRLKELIINEYPCVLEGESTIFFDVYKEKISGRFSLPEDKISLYNFLLNDKKPNNLNNYSLNNFLDETVGELDKYYVKTGIYDDEDRKEIIDITGGDYQTKFIADLYYYLTNRYSKDVTPTKLTEKERKLLIDAYNRIKRYDKNVLPIHDLYAREHNAHPLEKMNDLNTREILINRIKSLPSILLRNLRGDIRRERDHYELDKLLEYTKSIENSLNLIGRTKPEYQEKIMKKVFSSTNDTFEAVSKRLEDTTIPYLSQDDTLENIIEKVGDMGDEAEILYNENNILVVKINSPEAMGYIGCSSQWCFASNPHAYWSQYTSGSDGFATIVFNFNEEPSEPNAMVVVLESGEVYNMYNEYMEDGSEYLYELGVLKYIPQGQYTDESEITEDRKKSSVKGSHQSNINNLEFNSLDENNKPHLEYQKELNNLEQKQNEIYKRFDNLTNDLKKKYFTKYITSDELNNILNQTGDWYPIQSKVFEIMSPEDKREYSEEVSKIGEFLKKSQKYFFKQKINIDNRYRGINQFGMAGDVGSKYLYHFTTTDNAISILRDGYIMTGDEFVVSTTTNKNLINDIKPVFYHSQGDGYEGTTFRNLSTAFVLDFNKIKQDNIKFRKGNENRGTHWGEEEIQLMPVDDELDLYKYLVKVIFDPSKEKKNETSQNLIKILKEKNVQHFIKPNSKKTINEVGENPNCHEIQITDEIKNYVKNFDSDEKLLRSGGIPIEMLDMAAFGFNDETLKKLMPNQLSIKWKDDIKNVLYEIKKSGLKPKEWAKKIKLSEPIDVSFDGKKFYIEDGHHRFMSAKILNLPLNINLEIKSNPIIKLGGNLGYDDFHRCIWKQVHNGLNENVNGVNRTNMNNFIEIIKNKNFVQSLINDLNADIYLVGGAVRDLILNKPNKDIDLIVRNVPIDTLITHLQKFGKVDVVGKSFGVLKFIDSDGIDYDLALPRKEKPTGEGGYRGFDVQSDENLPIEADLIRRDAKMNAMAININTGKFIDPLGGFEDIEKKQISAANPDAFSDDPLRMLRIVAFTSRFGFKIESQTMKMIQDNAERIKEIPPERILMEFDKIVKKGNKNIGVQLLKDSGLFKQIFGFDLKQSQIDRNLFEEVKTMGEFIFLLIKLLPNPAEFYKNDLKGDIDTYKEIKALQMAFNSAETTSKIEARAVASNMFLTSPKSLNSQIIPNKIKIAADELLQGKYPKSVGELQVNGNDLMNIGLKGKEIGDSLKSMLLKIYSDRIRNNKEELLSLLPNKGNMIKEEGKHKSVEYGCLMLFLDVPIWEKIISIIKPDDVFEKDGEYGIEHEPHITIMYGFHDEVTAEDTFDLFKKHMPLEPIDVKIKGISVFENPEFDVVKFDVNSQELTKLNGIMRQLPNTTKFPEYHAHITIAYVKPGEGKKYVRPFEKERNLKGNELVYTWKGHNGKNGKIMSLDKKVGVLN